MKYEMTTYQDQKIEVTQEQAKSLADVAGLIELDVNGKTHFINPSSIANIVPKSNASEYKPLNELPISNKDHRVDVNSEGYKKFQEMKRQRLGGRAWTN